MREGDLIFLRIDIRWVCHETGFARENVHHGHAQQRFLISFAGCGNSLRIEDRQCQTPGCVDRTEQVEATNRHTCEAVLYDKPLKSAINVQRFLHLRGIEAFRFQFGGVCILIIPAFMEFLHQFIQ